MLLIGVRYFDREACGTGCALGVRPLVELIIVRGPGVIDDGKLDADLLRRRDWTRFSDPRTDTF